MACPQPPQSQRNESQEIIKREMSSVAPAISDSPKRNSRIILYKIFKLLVQYNICEASSNKLLTQPLPAGRGSCRVLGDTYTDCFAPCSLFSFETSTTEWGKVAPSLSRQLYELTLSRVWSISFTY